MSRLRRFLNLPNYHVSGSSPVYFQLSWVACDFFFCSDWLLYYLVRFLFYDSRSKCALLLRVKLPILINLSVLRWGVGNRMIYWSERRKSGKKLLFGSGPSCSGGGNGIQRMNRYPADKRQQNVPQYPPERDLPCV